MPINYFSVSNPFVHSYQCGGAVMNFVLALMNFIGLQREMQNTILVCPW